MMRDSAGPRQIARFCRKLLKEQAATAEPELAQQLQQWALECDTEADQLLPRAADQLREQARRHRQRAEEYRAIAEQMESPRVRASYRMLAESYDGMAEQLEAPVLPQRGEHEVN